MGKGGAGRGRKPNHGRGHRVGSMDDFMERNDLEGKQKDAPSGSESEGEAEASKPKKTSMMERDAELDAELEAQFADPSGLTRKQREELELQEQERKEEKAAKAGETDEAKETLARLEEVKKRRAEAAEKKKLEAEKAEVAEKKAEDTKPAVVPGRVVAEQILKFITESSDGKITLNQLNQDAGWKKVLKPLCKKENVKAMNKAWIDSFPDLLNMKEEGNLFVIYAAKGS